MTYLDVFKLLLYIEPRQNPNFSWIVDHPIIENICLADPDGGIITNIFEDTDGLERYREALIERLSGKDISSCVMMVRKQYRLFYLVTCVREGAITKAQGADEILDCWSSIETVYNDMNVDHKTLNSYLKEYRKNHSLEERVNGLTGEKITIYRGQIGPEGNSWTISKEKAEWFANRWNKGLPVWEGEIDLNLIVKYERNRGEEEIIVVDGEVQNIRRCED